MLPEPTPAQARAADLLVASCLARDGRPLEHAAEGPSIDWGHLLYLADINGLSCRLASFITGVDDARLPMRAVVRLSKELASQRRRVEALERVLARIRTELALGAAPVLLKGAAFKRTIYRARPEVRQVGDVDLLVAPQHEAPLVAWLEHQGYQTRAGHNGVTAIRSTDADRLVIDIHRGDPAKTRRSEATVYDLFQRFSVPTDDGYRVPTAELSLAHAAKHYCEHADDFRKVMQQDDLRMFRLVDLVQLFGIADPGAATELAATLGWSAELGRCVGYVEQLFGIDVPAEYPRQEDPVGLATPRGTLRWPWTFTERIRRVDRDEWVASQIGSRRSDWYTSAGGARTPSSPRPSPTNNRQTAMDGE